MEFYRPEKGRKYFQISIQPIFNDVVFKYRLIVFDVSKSETGEEVVEMRDIMHYKTLLDAAADLSFMVGDPEGYAEFPVLD